MKNKINLNSQLRKAIILSAIFFIVIIVGCKKDGELVPEFDNGDIPILFTDTFSIKTSVEIEDSLRTDVAAFNLLGIYNDPIFGPTSSSIYSQVTLNGLDVDFGTAPVLDSIVLTLKYSDIYGDSSAMAIDVFQVTEPMSSSTSYYSNQFLTNDLTPIASKTFIPNTTDSVYVKFDSTNVAPHLRINLGNTFGQSILNASATDLATNDAFTSFMNGLYITSQESVDATTLLPGEGSIVYFDVNSEVSTVTVYYNDTLSYEFLMNSESVKYSRFDHNYAGTDIEDQLNGAGDTALTYIQALAGIKTKLEIPHIKNIIEDGPVIINKAELVVTLDSGSDDDYTAIQTLQIVGIDADGQPFFISDFFEGASFYGGGIEVDGQIKTYTFNISRHIHDLIYNTPIDYGMYIFATSKSISANRTVIRSEKSPTGKMKLNITYSKL